MEGKTERVTLIVLDSLGIGALPDAADFGDAGTNTLAHIIDAMPELRIPHLRALGLCNIDGAGLFAGPGTAALALPAVKGAFGRMGEASNGKDTITGHWEIAGLLTQVPFQTFPKFPDDFMRDFEAAIGLGCLGNYAASGTVIIDELGPEHERTGKPIVYTSSDSVFQIAANTALIPLARLYEICEIAREMLRGPMLVGRVIARPYIMEDGKRVRTAARHDYAVSPTGKTLLDHVQEAGQEVIGVGKIEDIFAGQGVSRSIHTEDNEDGIRKTIETMKEKGRGLLFTNLVDFDSKYGHRRDIRGYGAALEQFDACLPEIFAAMGEEEILMLTADHGNDPAHSGTDHTREYIPLLVCGRHIKENHNLGTRSAFADIGATIAEALGVAPTEAGRSFLSELWR